MANKHEAHKPDTNKWTGLGQETKHRELVRYGPFTSKIVKPVFLTKPCLIARLVRFLIFFFFAYRATGLGQKKESGFLIVPDEPGPGRVARFAISR